MIEETQNYDMILSLELIFFKYLICSNVNLIFQVVVKCPSTGIKQTFPCNAWLADDEGDKRIERRLTEDLSLRKTRPPSK
jgi:hypothetical protein